MEHNITRGIRNNNPCNIRKGGSSWLGEVNLLNGKSDESFCQFKNMVYGLRAAFKTLKTYREKYGTTTVSGIIQRWAPPADGNNTENYIKCVEKISGINRIWPIFDNESQLYIDVVEAMCWVESKYTPNKDDLLRAFKMVFD